MSDIKYPDIRVSYLARTATRTRPRIAYAARS
jgi:hypothetical protein